jgi:drug/metabolite transporter (DMT)-like permease
LWSVRTVWRSAVPYGIVVALGEACFYLAADAADRLLLTSIVMPVSLGSCILLFTLYCCIVRGERLSPGGWIAIALDIVGIALLSCR